MPLYLKHAGAGKVDLKEGPILVPGDGQLLVRVSVVAGNPVDLDLSEGDPNIVGSTVGYDFAGTISALGPNTTKFKLGDRVAGFASLSGGSFGEYCIGFEHATFKIPVGMSDEEAATLPSALVVTAIGLYQFLQLPSPGSEGAEKEAILIWGGSTTMGSMALQFAKASGAFPIVASASPKNFDFVKSLGADYVVDYNDPDASKKVREFTGNKLAKAMDAFSRGDSFARSTECMGEKGGTMVLLNPMGTASTRTDVKFEFVNSFLSLGLPFTIFAYPVPAVPEMKEFIRYWFTTVADPLLAENKIKPQRTKLIPNGLKGVEAGWQLYREGKVSSEKLIYRIADTPGVQD